MPARRRRSILGAVGGERRCCCKRRHTRVRRAHGAEGEEAREAAFDAAGDAGRECLDLVERGDDADEALQRIFVIEAMAQPGAIIGAADVAHAGASGEAVGAVIAEREGSAVAAGFQFGEGVQQDDVADHDRDFVEIDIKRAGPEMALADGAENLRELERPHPGEQQAAPGQKPGAAVLCEGWRGGVFHAGSLSVLVTRLN